MQAHPPWLHSAQLQPQPPMVPPHQPYPHPHNGPPPQPQQRTQAGPHNKGHGTARTDAQHGFVGVVWTDASHQQQQPQQRHLHMHHKSGQQQQIASSIAGLSAKPVLPVFSHGRTAAAAQTPAQQTTSALVTPIGRSPQAHSHAAGQARVPVQQPGSAPELPGKTTTAVSAPRQVAQLPAQLPPHLPPQHPQAHAYPQPLQDPSHGPNSPSRLNTPAAGTTPDVLSKQAAAKAAAGAAASVPTPALSVQQLPGGRAGLQSARMDGARRQSGIVGQAPSPAQAVVHCKQQVCFCLWPIG